ncbi:MAG: hypothetical protein EPO02_13570 [Nitrospirae bacterium]|nr:MAG: hypothetical protein EPO02_13570 [Nitrospirota bacterium]
MTDFYPQSTDQLGGSTNPNRGNVIARGSFLNQSMSSAGTGYSLSLSVALPIDTANFFLNAIGFTTNWNLGAGTIENFPIPFNQMNISTGNVQRNGNLYIMTSTKPTSYSLNIDLWDRSISQSGINIYYKVLAFAF